MEYICHQLLKWLFNKNYDCYKNILKIFSKLSYDFLQKRKKKVLATLRLLGLLIQAYKIQTKSCASIYEYCVASITVKTSNYNSTYKSSKTKIRSISQKHQIKIWKWTPAFFTSCKWRMRIDFNDSRTFW